MTLRVVKLTRVKLATPVPVYDLTSPRTSNFALGCGAVVHNSAEFAKMPWQEILPLRGKMANVITKKGALENSERVTGILKSVGYDPGDDRRKLRVSKIILLPDADDDGDHISVLLMTVFQMAMPRLMREGRLYVCDAPLFEAQDSRGEKVLGDRLQEMERRHGSLRNVSRMKGWGGCPVPLLRTVAFDPSSRKILRVAAPTAQEARGLVSLMGADSAGRKALLNGDEGK